MRTGKGRKSQLVPVWNPESRAPWDGSRLVVLLEDLAEFCRRERVTVKLGAPDEWDEGQIPEYTVRSVATTGVQPNARITVSE